MALDPFPHPLGERHRVIELGARKEEHEFLAAIAPDAVDLACFVPQDSGELLEHFVACLMPVRIVHTLEFVQVAHHQREGLPEPLRMREHLVDALVQVASVVEPRERIGLRHEQQLLVHLEQLLLALLERFLQPLDAQH